MPNNIESRIVEMEFDNRQFERGAQQTLTTLRDLKSSLDFKNVGSGLDALGTSINKLDIGGSLSDSIEIGIQSMSKFQAFSLGVFEELGRKVTNLGLQIANELFVAQKKAGFGEYELELGSVQTIRASTGEQFDKIYDYLAELNTYADKTIYSFSDMTSNIGKFTNAGVELDTAVKAIQGISNEAALSGANANEASRAMYNFAQALSSGAVKLIDWKSIENANMATVEFKQELLDTALALGTVVKKGDKYISTTTNAQGKVSDAFNATANFNDSLSAQWMTTEVLTETLARYSDETTDLGKRAFAAAQDVKSFSQLIDTLKEAIGSGWAESFRIIFGEFEDAKKLWTGVSITLGGVIDSFSNLRNHALRYWKDEGGRTKLLNSLIRLWKIFSERVKIIGESFYASFPIMNRTGHVLMDLTTRFQKFTIGLKKGFLGNKESLENFRKSTDRVFHGVRALMHTIRDISSIFVSIFKVALESVNSELDNTRSISEIFESIALHIMHAAKALKTWATQSDRLKALSTIFRAILAVGELIVEVFKQVYSAFRPVVKESANSEPTFLNLVAKIAELVIKLKDFVTESKIVERVISGIINVIKKFKPVLEGFKKGFGFIKDKQIVKGLKSIGDGFKKLFKSIFSSFKSSKDISKSVGKDSKQIGKVTTSVYSRISEAFKKFMDSIKALANKFKSTIIGLFRGAGKATEDAGKETEHKATGLTYIAEKLLELLSKTVDKLKPLGKQLKDSIVGLFGGFNRSSKKAEQEANTAANRPVSFIENFINKVKDLLHKINEGINVTEITQTIGEGIKKVWIGLTEDPLLTALVGGWLQLIGVAKTIVSPIKSLSGGIDTLTEGAKKSMDATTGFINSLKSSVDEWKKAKTAEMFRDIAIAMLLVAASVALITYAFSKDGAAATVGLGAVVGLLLEMSGIVKGLAEAFPNPVDLSSATNAMLKMSVAVFLMGTAIAKVAKAGKNGNMASLVVAISGIVLIMASITAMVKLFLTTSADLGKQGRKSAKTMSIISSMLIAISAAIWIISKPVKSLAKLDWESLSVGLVGVVAIMGMLTGFMKLISTLSLKPDQFTASASFIAVLSYALLGLANVVKVLAKLDGEGLQNGLLGLTTITGVLLIFFYVIGQTLNGVKPTVLTSAATAIILMAVGIRILVSSVKALSGEKFESLGPGLGAIAIVLASVVVALIALSKISSGGALILTSMALLVTSVALVALTAAVKRMEAINWDKIKGGLLSLGVVLAGLVILSFFAQPLLVLSAAFITFGAAVLLIGTGVKRTAKGIQTLVNAFVSLAAAWPLIETMVDGFLTIAASYIPMVASKAVEGIRTFAEKIIETAPTIAEAIKTLVLSVFDALYGYIPDLVDQAVDIVLHVLRTLKKHAKEIFESLFSIIVTFLEELEAKMPELTELIGNILVDLIVGSINVTASRVMEFAQSIYDLIISIINALTTMFDDEHVDAFIEASNKLVENFTKAVLKVVSNSSDIFEKIGIQVITHIVKGLKSRVGRIGKTIKRGIDGVLSIAGTRFEDLKELGSDLIQKLIDGLVEKWDDVKENLEMFGESVLETLADAFGIESPSKETEEQGKYLDLGLAKGVTKYSKYATDAADDTAGEVSDSFSSIQDALPDFSNLDSEYGPTITPTLDDSDMANIKDFLSGVNNDIQLPVGFDTSNISFGDTSATMAQQTNETVNASFNDDTQEMYESLKGAIEDLIEMLTDVTIISDEATLSAEMDVDGQTLGEIVIPFVDAAFTGGSKKAKSNTAQSNKRVRTKK